MDSIKMENKEAKAHELVHEISFELENGNIGKTKEILLELDILLHGETNPLLTPAVNEINLDERAGETPELLAERYVVNKYGFNCGNPIYNQMIHAEQKAYIKGYTDSTHNNHASFVALVEALKTLLSFTPDKKELGGSAWDSDFGIAILKAEEALNKIK